MTFRRPTLADLATRAQADVEGALEGAHARLYGTPEHALALVVAGLVHGLHGHISYAERSLFPHLAADEWIDPMLEIWKVSDGEGGYGRLPAQRATGVATLTGAGGSTVPTGTRLAIGEQIYTVDAGYTYVLAGDTDHDFDVTAYAAGESSNATSGSAITLVTPIMGVHADGTVAPGGLIGGTDRETVEAARVRLLARVRAPGAGGARGDFAPMAQEASVLVTRAWELPRYAGNGTMVLLIANDNETPPLADAALVADVQEYLQDVDDDGYVTGVAPTSAIVTVAAASMQALAVTASITLETGAIWINDDGTGVRADVEIEIAGLIERIAGPGITITKAEISGAIQRAAGVKSHTLAVPAADVTHTDLQVPYVGVLTLTES